MMMLDRPVFKYDYFKNLLNPDGGRDFEKEAIGLIYTNIK
jgi:hypothetical protein